MVRILLVGTALMALAGCALADTITVDVAGGGDYTTIGEGMVAAADGDTVLVRPGLYQGPLNRELDFSGKTLVVRSEAGPDSTTIDCGELGRAFKLESGEGPLATIEGFTIRNGYARSDTVGVTDRYGGAVMCYGASVWIRNVVFIDNTAERDGGAVCIWEGGPNRLTDCVFDSNTAARHGGGVNTEYCMTTVTRCTFTGNDAGQWGGGIRYGFGSGNLTDVTFTDNAAGFGGAALFRNSGVHHLWDCTFEGNSCSQWGGAVHVFDGGASFVGCCFAGNSATYGAAAVAFKGSSGSMLRCTLTGNYGDHDAGTISCNESSPVITNCTFVANVTPTGGAILCQTDAAPVITNTILANTVDGPPVACTAASCAAEVSYSCVYGNAGGDSLCCDHHDNLFEDPLFCDGEPCAYLLQDCSPCLDGGEGGATIGASGAGCPCDDLTSVASGGGEFAALGCAPNPTSGSVAVCYERFGAPARVTLTLFSISGREVAVVDGISSGRGREQIRWDTRSSDGCLVASGVYFYELADGEESVHGSLAVMR